MIGFAIVALLIPHQVQAAPVEESNGAVLEVIEIFVNGKALIALENKSAECKSIEVGRARGGAPVGFTFQQEIEARTRISREVYLSLGDALRIIEVRECATIQI